MTYIGKHLVSVIVPHYNRNELISNLIQNIIHQEYRPIEVILIDDGSDTPISFTAGVSDDVPVRVINLTHSGCPGSVRNVGIQAANGKFIAFLDSDDLWLPQKLRLQMEVFDKKPFVDLCHGNVLIIKDGTPRKVCRHLSTGHQLSYGELLLKDNVFTSSVIAKKIIFTTEQFNKYPSAQDYELWLRLVRKFNFFYLSEPLYIYADTKQDSISRKSIQRYLNLLKIFRLQQSFCTEQKLHTTLYRRMAGFYFKLAKYSFLRGRVIRCRSLLWQSLRYRVTIHAVIALALLTLGPRLLRRLYAGRD